MTNPVADYSYLSNWTCAQYGHYRYIDGIVPKDQPDYIRAGSAGHAGLAAFGRGAPTAKIVEAIEDAWGPRTLLTAGVGLDTVISAVLRFCNDNPDWLQSVALWAEPGNPNPEPLVELAFSTTLPRYGVAYGGRVDVVRQDEDCAFVVTDYKLTRSALTGFFDDRFIRSYQLLGYMCLIRLATGIPVERAEVKAIYIGDSKTYQVGETRTITVFDGWHPEMMDELEEWVFAMSHRIADAERSGLTPQLAGAMFRQHICRRCAYRDLCEAYPDERDGLKELLYEQAPAITGLFKSGA